jgi:hypothetical protein
MSPDEMRLDMLVAELDYENRLLRARNERLEREAEQRSQQQEPLTGGDERRHIICLCPDCTKPAQQEPVGEVSGYYDQGFTEHKTLYGKLHNQDLPVGTKLYTSPPASKPWVGLTDDEIHDIYDEVARREPYNMAVTRRNIARSLEAILREKNQ